jgi:hypothetical protein
MVLDVPAQQVMGQPLIGSPSILLLDDTGGLVTTYDLASDPITITSSIGQLTSGVIDNPAWFSGGVVDLSQAGIVYSGESGPVDLTAANAAITSQPLRVSFNGYQIRHTEYPSGDTITNVHTDLVTQVTVVLVNGGDRRAEPDPSVKAFFRSGGGSLKAFYAGRSGGVPDTMNLELPTTGLALGEDTLILVAESEFDFGTGRVMASDTLALPVTILPTMAANLVAGSLSPDSVYSGTPFQLRFDVATTGFVPPVDSTRIRVSLLNSVGATVAVALDDLVDYDQFESDTVRYRNLEALVNGTGGLPTGWYDLDISYASYLGGQMIMFRSTAQDSLLILPGATLEYVPGSLSPTQVAGGVETGYQFDLTLSGSDPLLLDSAGSSFILYGEDFGSGVNLIVPNDTLRPGPNRLQTGLIYVPTRLTGDQIRPELTLQFYHPGAANRLSLASDFEGAVIEVGSVALIQIIEVKVLAPNGPMVNTGQNFQIACRLANLTETPQGEFEIQLVSNGGSEFTSLLTVSGIPGYGEVEVFFDLTAAAQPNESELFRVDIASVGVTQQPPLDNIALVTIQRPANLFVTSILVGADSGYVDIGQSFDLILGVGNNGQAAATDARFRVSTNGMYLGLPGGALEIEALIPVDEVRGFSFVAPQFDTLIKITVELIEHPLDINYGLPAPITDTLIDLELAVTSLDIALELGVADGIGNVVRPDGVSELLRLIVVNPGLSSIAEVRLENMSFLFSNRDGSPGDVWSLIEVGSTALYDGDRRVTTSTAGQNRLHLNFGDFTIPAGDTVELALRSRVKATAATEFGVSLATWDVDARYASGPLQGRAVPVVSSTGGDLIVEEPFVSAEAKFSGSFMMRNNPFNPREEQAEFRYYLERAEEVTFRLLTLTGELVVERVFAADSPGAREGENVVFWDGHNDGGQEVLNGVYVAVLTTAISGEQVTLKVAVLK